MDNHLESEEETEEAETCYDFTKKTWRDDVTFLVEGQRLYATKAILAIASPVFEAMFGTSFEERYKEDVPLPGKMFEDFNEFLLCIYPNSQKKIDKKNVYKVLPLADEYDVKSLIKKCRRFLNHHLINDHPSTREVVQCHGLATRHKFQRLREVCATRLSNVELNDIESTGLADTETLLQIYKDVLEKKGDNLVETRTELVNLYLNNNLPDISSSLNTSETRGSILKLELNTDSLRENERRFSNTETLWGIAFKAEIRITKRADERYLSLYLSAKFPKNNEQSICSISTKCLLKRSGRGERSISFMMKDQEYSKESPSLGYSEAAKIRRSTEGGVDEKETIDMVVYLLSRKPFVRN